MNTLSIIAGCLLASSAIEQVETSDARRHAHMRQRHQEALSESQAYRDREALLYGHVMGNTFITKSTGEGQVLYFRSYPIAR